LAYVDAGADGVFVPGLRDERVIEQLVATLGETPLNLLAQLPFHRLGELGVRRVSTGSLPFRVAITQATSAVTAYATGAPTPATMSYDEAQALTIN
jgi:2-methylisocitrate lyase-like PEP mutase family enzyme